MIRVLTPLSEESKQPTPTDNRVKTYERVQGCGIPTCSQSPNTSNFCRAGLGLTSPAFLGRAGEERRG